MPTIEPELEMGPRGTLNTFASGFNLFLALSLDEVENQRRRDDWSALAGEESNSSEEGVCTRGSVFLRCNDTRCMSMTLSDVTG